MLNLAAIGLPPHVVIFVKYREVSTCTILLNFIDLSAETALYSRFGGHKGGVRYNYYVQLVAIRPDFFFSLFMPSGCLDAHTEFEISRRSLNGGVKLVMHITLLKLRKHVKNCLAWGTLLQPNIKYTRG